MIDIVFRSNELDLLILQNGKNGMPGNSKFTWVKFSQYADGHDMTDDPNNALYMGIAYNKDESLESDNPSDYTWIKIKGDPGSNGYTVIVNNENISFAVESNNRIPTVDQSYVIEVSVFQGTEEREDFTIGELSADSGIQVSKNNHTITISVSKGTSIANENGSISVPVNIDGLVFVKEISWSLTHQGQIGQAAINAILGNETQNIPCNENGTVVESLLIEIPFSAYIGTQKTSCSAVVGVLPSGMTLGSNTASTGSDDGKIVLNVSKNANLGGSSVRSGTINIEIVISDSISIDKKFTWSKTNDGASTDNFHIYSMQLSSLIMVKGIDNSLSPSSITANAFVQNQNPSGLTQSDYNGRFIVEESINGTQYEVKYTSSSPESSTTYTPTSSNIKYLRFSLCESSDISLILDRQTVTIISAVDDLNPVIQEMQTQITGIENSVDAIENKITNKVWESDITTAINNYNGTTIKTLEDKVSSQEISIEGIKNTVSDVKTEVTGDIQALTEQVSSYKQESDSFQQTVSETYATKSDLENTSDSLTSQITQTASSINQKITNISGDVSDLTQNVDGITQKVQNAEGNISKLQTTANNIQSQVTDNESNITSLQQTSQEIQTEVSKKQPYPLTSIRYIRDWLNGSSVDGNNYYVDCRVMSGGTNIAEGIIAVAKNSSLSNLSQQPSNIGVYTDGEIITYNSNGYVNTNSYVSLGTGNVCMQLDLGSKKSNIDYIQIIHYYIDNRIYNHKLEVSEDGNVWVTLYDSDVSGGYEETQDGRTYNISDGYINDQISQVTQTINGISSVVQSNSDNISRLEQTSNSFTSQIQQIQSDVNSANDSIQNINNEIAANQSSIQQTINEIKTSVSGLSDDMTSVAQTVVEQSSTEWKALFSQIGMGDYPNKNTNVIMSSNGLTVRNPDTGIETVMSPDQFAGYYMGDIVFQLNKDLTITRRIQVDNGADFTTIKYINRTYTSSNKKIGALVHIKSGGSS